jgi:PAS domain S-box-containing protein
VADILSNKNFALAFGAGTVAATGWYAGAAALLTGQADYFVPIGGAIAIAGLIPALLHRNCVRKQSRMANLALTQRLNVLDRHLMVNVVDHKHVLTEVNDHLVKVTGFSRNELIGYPVNKLFCRDKGQTIADEIRAALIRGETWQGETPLRCKDGSLLFTQTTVIPLFNERGEWTGSISARSDITRAKKLMAEHETMDTLEELRDDIWIVDAESEKITYMNRAAMRRTDWTNRSYKSKTLGDVMAKDRGAKAIVTACRELKETGEGMTHFETSLKGVPFLVSIKFLRVNSAEDRFLVMLNDISDRHAEEQKKSDFIAMVSHELRSPLTSIKGSMGLLLSNATGELPPKALALLEIAHRNADRLVLIINDILDLEKISAGRMDFDLQEADMAELIRETNQATEMMQQRYAIKLETTGIDHPIPLQTDSTRIIQVLTNFLSNACKFSKPNGKIIVDVHQQENQLRVSVTDEGPGIPVSDQHKIFERFADLENSDRSAKGGTGLGLSICKAIVESLGGTIGFETEENVGTTFYFVLPHFVRTDAGDQREEEFREAS